MVIFNAQLILNHLSISPNKNYPHIYEVELTNLAELAQYDSIEVHFVVYPYSREISAEKIEIHPFEEYIEDILDKQKSLYKRIEDGNNKRFGLGLAAVVMLIMATFKPEEFLAVQSIVSVFGAYIAGKELWGDLEKYLVYFTQKGKIRFFTGYFSYQLERNTTFANYTQIAKKNRYEKDAIIPEKIDYIEQSNSKTIRLSILQEDLQKLAKEKSAHLFSIHLSEEIADIFRDKGRLFGVKISLNSHKWLYKKSIELYQSQNNTEFGALNEANVWLPDSIFQRITFYVGKWKYYHKTFVIPKKKLFMTYL